MYSFYYLLFSIILWNNWQTNTGRFLSFNINQTCTIPLLIKAKKKFKILLAKEYE